MRKQAFQWQNIKQLVPSERQMCDSLLNKLFDDRRLIVSMLMGWLILVFAGFFHLGLLETDYITWGPSEHTVFMTITLDTWKKWSLVAVFTAINTMVNDFASDSLGPFFVNVVSDHKSRYLPYSKTTCIMITQMYTIYGALISVITLHLLLSQIDFVVIRLVTDLATNVWTQSRLLRYKEHNSEKYKETEMHLVHNDSTAATQQGEDTCIPLVQSLN